LLKIKNASSQEAMFILCAHVLGEPARRAPVKFKRTFNHTEAELFGVREKLTGFARGNSAHRKQSRTGADRERAPRGSHKRSFERRF
jgi:hypothetical protein